MSVLSSLGFDTGRITKEGLKRLNITSAVLLFIQAVILLIIGNASGGSRPVSLGYLSKDPLSTATGGQASYLPAGHHFFDISLLYILVFTLLAAALGYLASATFWRSTYEADLSNSLNRLRWRFGALIGGLVMVTIGLLVGMSDLALLILVFGLSVGSHLFALLAEQLKSRLKAGEKLKYWGGIMPAILAWLAVALYVKASYIYGTGSPSYLYIIPAVMLVLFIAIALVRYKQLQRAGNWSDYMYVERTYIVLGLVSLTVLSWMVYGWLLH